MLIIVTDCFEIIIGNFNENEQIDQMAIIRLFSIFIGYLIGLLIKTHRPPAYVILALILSLNIAGIPHDIIPLFIGLSTFLSFMILFDFFNPPHQNESILFFLKEGWGFVFFIISIFPSTMFFISLIEEFIKLILNYPENEFLNLKMLWHLFWPFAILFYVHKVEQLQPPLFWVGILNGIFLICVPLYVANIFILSFIFCFCFKVIWRFLRLHICYHPRLWYPLSSLFEGLLVCFGLLLIFTVFFDLIADSFVTLIQNYFKNEFWDLNTLENLAKCFFGIICGKFVKKNYLRLFLLLISSFGLFTVPMLFDPFYFWIGFFVGFHKTIFQFFFLSKF